MFSDIIGQKEYIQALKLAIDSNKLPHALLISGNEGTGGLALAYAAAQYLMCTDRRGEDACGECAQCIQINKLQHPDLHFVYPVVNKGGTSKDASVSTDFIQEWREAFLNNQYITLSDWLKASSEENKNAQIFVSEANNIIKELSTKPYESDFRVMIIWLPEKMREDTANKLLKILEEPYENTHFFLVSNDPEHIIGTIMSRVQRLNLPPITDEDLATALQQRHGCDISTARDYARMSHGSYVSALKLMNEDEDRKAFFEQFCSMMRLSYARKLFDMKAWSDNMATLGRERQKSYLQYAQEMIRENFIMNLEMPELNYFNEQERNFSARFHNFVNEKNIEEIMNELATAEKDIAQNANAKMVFFDLSLKLIMLLKKGGS